MDLEINIEKKDLRYKAGNASGKSLKELIEAIDRITPGTIRLTGESESYTFLRQVALFFNLLKKTSNVAIHIDSKSFDVKKNTIFPIYK